MKKLLVLLILLFFLLFPPVVFAQVVINEFSARSQPDWVELYNTGDKIIDL